MQKILKSSFIVIFFYLLIALYYTGFNQVILDMYDILPNNTPYYSYFFLNLDIYDFLMAWLVISFFVFLKDSFFKKKLSFYLNIFLMVAGVIFFFQIQVMVDIFHIWTNAPAKITSLK